MITIDNLWRSFAGREVLKGVSFCAEDGRITGFVGPNGAGKSTTFKVLLGLLPPDRGSAGVDGRAFAASSSPGAAVGAYLGPADIPSDMTGLGFLTYVADLKRVSRAEAKRYLEHVGLADSAQLKIARYSLGMRQRLGVAAAFVGEPRNLVLDEPVNGLDVEGVRWLRDFLREVASEGRCVLLSSHLLSELELVADDVVLLGEGKITRGGTLTMLRSMDEQIVVVRSQNNEAMMQVLLQAGMRAQAQNNEIHVHGASVNQVAGVGAASQVELVAVGLKERRLEDVYLDEVNEHSPRRSCQRS